MKRLLFVAAACCLAAGEPSQRDIVREAIRFRPSDPWPRGSGHVVLALPGSAEEQKAYLEPGGSFSPIPGSFGVSFWIRDRGKITATSDSIPVEQTQQRFEWGTFVQKPAVSVTTPHYKLRWFLEDASWVAEIDSPREIEVAIRSVGPAGGPITSLEWRDLHLRINGAWVVQPPLRAALVGLGEEVNGNWSTPSGSPPPAWRGSSGWGYAIFRLPAGKSRFMIGGTTLPDRDDSIEPGPDLNLPDTDFVECLRAQVAHLQMSTVKGETRPGDPMNYPLAWLRDGTYALTALARAGRLSLAQDLATKFAEDDFFGGFGSEADGPGLALWALEEVASRIDDRAFDEYLWPNVERKANLIAAMMTASEPLRYPYTGPIVPEHANKRDLDLVAGPPKNGLIDGRMDHHRPLLFVNAVSVKGLESAAAVASRTGHASEASLYAARAGELRRAWVQAFHTAERANDRTFISGLWPTDVAAPIREEFRAALSERQPLSKRPEWTYFTLAEAHQWLRLGEPERAWSTVRWFWDHQLAPGLYTWWEGTREENTFHRWENVRGWIAPAHVTPHYWTASEMLLLQLEMLAYLDGDTLVVGAGVPKDWLAKKMSVRGLPFGGHRVDWSWDGKRLKVDQHGGRYQVRPAGAFAGVR